MIKGHFGRKLSWIKILYRTRDNTTYNINLKNYDIKEHVE
jgi:hypothetical protein